MNKVYRIMKLISLTIILTVLLAVSGWLFIERQALQRIIGSVQDEREKLTKNLIWEQEKSQTLAREFESRINDITAQNTSLLNDKQDYIDKIQSLDSNIRSLEKQLDAAVKNREAFAADNLTIALENRKLKDKIEILNDQIKKSAVEFRIRLEQLAAENSRFTEKNTDLEAKIDQLTHENIVLAEQNISLTRENNFYLDLTEPEFAVDDPNNIPDISFLDAPAENPAE